MLALRRRQVKNFCALLFLSNGTPMFCAGDEFMQTQGGNNNPYNQDNETTWLDWSRLERNADVYRFFKMMIALPQGAPVDWAEPVLARRRAAGTASAATVDWSDESHQLAYCLHGASQGDRDLYVMLNAGAADVKFRVQEGDAAEWARVVDTAQPSPQDIVREDKAVRLRSRGYLVRARSVVVLVRDRGTAPPKPTAG